MLPYAMLMLIFSLMLPLRCRHYEVFAAIFTPRYAADAAMLPFPRSRHTLISPLLLR